MSINVKQFWNRLFHEQNNAGDNFYNITNFNEWTDSKHNVDIALNHPILTPALLFVSELFSQAKFHIKDKVTNKNIYNHKLLDLLNNPNLYMSSHDFLATIMFLKKVNGVVPLYLKRGIGIKDPNAIYPLDNNLIEYPENFKTGLNHRSKDDAVLNQKITYDREGENLTIKIKDLIFIYDLPPGINTRNKFKAEGVVNSLKQTLINTQDSLIAKNIILKTNGKELISGNNKGFPLNPTEKEDVENLVNKTYGLGFGRKRGLVTKAGLTWKSMHIALRDLGLDESVKVDGNIIYTALHIPKDIISLEAKKTTYNNFKESMVSYIQNGMQAAVADLTNTFNNDLLSNNRYELVASYEHLPIMQFILIERFEGLIKKGNALYSLRKAGLPDDLALTECGYSDTIKLNPITNGKSKEENTEENSNEGNEED